MKRHTCLTVLVIGAAALSASAVAASRSTHDLDALVARINKTSSTSSQATYSRQLHMSVNAAAVQHLERTCARKHAGTRVQTFTMLGVVRLDGVLQSPAPLPENAFTTCMADKMTSLHFPLPPENGWPVAMQFDAKTGRMLYMAGDRQPAMPLYRPTPRQWMYTPVPVIPANLRKACVTSVWMSVGVHGRVESVDMGDTSCPSSLSKAVMDTAQQWLNIAVHDSISTDPTDVRITFNIGKARVKVKL
jgi:hypothetical protein